MKKIKSLLLSLALLFGVAAFVPATNVDAALSADCGGIENCLEDGAQSTDPDSDGDAGEQVNDIIVTVINVFSIVVGVVAVIMIIIGGLKYITSGGDSGNVSGAKNTILYAVIGLVVVALAQVIVRFVLQSATDV